MSKEQQPEQLDDDPGDSERGYCSTCSNTGMLNCYCGGDLCVCENQGEFPCPKCNGD